MQFNSDIWIMNRIYNWFNSHKWIDFSGADYLTDNDEFSIFFLDRCNRLRLQRGERGLLQGDGLSRALCGLPLIWKRLSTLVFLFWCTIVKQTKNFSKNPFKLFKSIQKKRGESLQLFTFSICVMIKKQAMISLQGMAEF